MVNTALSGTLLPHDAVNSTAYVKPPPNLLDGLSIDLQAPFARKEAG